MCWKSGGVASVARVMVWKLAVGGRGYSGGSIRIGSRDSMNI